jgi:DNA-binding response OmpR family regulator
MAVWGWALPMLAIKDRAVIVLFVDDDAAFAAMGALYLESQGMRPIVVSGSMAALQVFETQAIDVVVTDVKLGAGEPHGLSLARMIRHKNPKMPVILMTVDPQLVEGEAMPGPLLKKPFDFAELCRAIEERSPR